ncbi:lysylphosphatidylglycerol synthase domain-containing protein [Lacinutrix neustonica]|uniref:Lysylphosphatidylglycerol synthase domain-containing protein n=1 Tax=Lacinutrix neustonica TaxID=2980107 RepID=A0A9E8MTR6_9FLAO|nr:lysylphosphatidylglycerol synthase domain-containing protein [Lacinutrix neustonica]WAC01333.1 lysylphosphatidylglycerol synthase domain-containing protein [Lacinutrix neustonica]
MYNTVSYKTKQFFFVLIKLSIVVAAFYFMYNKLVNNGTLDFAEFINILNKKNVFSVENIFFLIFLSLFNWFFEIFKWKILVTSIKEITFFEALQQSLGAFTASLFTPNRIGEYGAKAVYYTKNYRKKVLLLNLLSNVMQMGVTIVMGCVGFWLFISKYALDINYVKVSRYFIIIAVISTIIVIVLKKTQYKIKGFPFEKIKNFIKKLSFNLKVLAVILSFIRYGTFSFQFYFLLHLFGTPLAYYEAMIVITTYYLLVSVAPTIYLFDVVIKGSVAVYLFSFTDINDISVLCIVTLMWLLNFVIPSLFGSYFVLRFNLPKQDVSC